jgi:hypothetical protein
VGKSLSQGTKDAKTNSIRKERLAFEATVDERKNVSSSFLVFVQTVDFNFFKA